LLESYWGQDIGVTLFLNIAGHLAAMIAAGIAIVGTTWNSNALGWAPLH
jgi:hypothetical protein